MTFSIERKGGGGGPAPCLKITAGVINLSSVQTDCAICGVLTELGLYLPVYEGRMVSDDCNGEWAGQPVCGPCFRLKRLESKGLVLEKEKG